ncbi:pentapeptide repeat-containing protein [Lusitaniella coriacea]|uniref:pentapeptide repeat-containing protein n=1 Tax=Lusitaniella coriacea TaxID=1983105 RepID=UPI003CE84035
MDLEELLYRYTAGERDFSQVDLRRTDLRGASLSETNFFQAYLDEANLNGADLRRANFNGAYLRGANLNEANLRGANLRGASLWETFLVEANLRGAYLNDANLWGANLREANLIDSTCNGADFSGANLRGADLSRAVLSRTHLSGANLSGTNLSSAILSGSVLCRTVLINANLSRANLSCADLSGADLSGGDLLGANLIGANLQDSKFIRANLIGAKFNDANLAGADLSQALLSGANLNAVSLQGANLTGVDLSGFDFNGLDLSEVNLSEANLTRVQALATNFQGAILTGTCIEDWHIDSATCFEGVVCDYIYLKANRQERRPRDGNCIFAVGEFTQLFQKTLETVDLIFHKGIDWRAFLPTFEQLQQESQFVLSANSPQLFIQGIENQSDGALIVRVNVPAQLDKREIEQAFFRKYEQELQRIEMAYRQMLQVEDREIEWYKHQNADITEISKLLANRPMIVAEEGVLENGDGDGANKHDLETEGVLPQVLVNGAAEIQQLLQDLEQHNPMATEGEKQAFVTAALLPSKREQLSIAFQTWDRRVFEQFLDVRYGDSAIAIIESWSL